MEKQHFIKNIKIGTHVSTSFFSKDNSKILAKVVKCRKEYGELILYIRLPYASINILKNNFIESFEWKWYNCCVHRPYIDTKLETKNWIQLYSRRGNSFNTNNKKKRRKIGYPKSTSRAFLVIPFDENGNDWEIITNKQYNLFCKQPTISIFCNVMLKNLYINIYNKNLWRNIFKYLK